MKFLYYKILSRLPNKKGKNAYEKLAKVLKKGITFKVKKIKDKQKGTYYIAESLNIPQKEIITSGRNLEELLENIKDATYAAFEVPAYYWESDNLVSQYSDQDNKSIELRYAAAC